MVWRGDLVGIEAAGGNDLLDLGDRNPARGRHIGVEVARCLAEDQIALGIGFPRLDDRKIGSQPGLAHIERAVELLMRLRSEEHTSELQSLMRISYAVFCLKKKHNTKTRYR